MSENDCDDGNSCNIDMCDPVLGCVSVGGLECTGRNFIEDLSYCTCECDIATAQLGCEDQADELQCLCTTRPDGVFTAIRVEYQNEIVSRSVNEVTDAELAQEVYRIEELTSRDVEIRNQIAVALSVPEELLYLVGGTTASNGNPVIVLDVYGQEQLSAGNILAILASLSNCATVDPNCDVDALSTIGAIGVTRISIVERAAPHPIEGISEEGGGAEIPLSTLDIVSVPKYAPFTDTVPYTLNSIPSDPRIVYVSVSSSAQLCASVAMVASMLLALLFSL